MVNYSLGTLPHFLRPKNVPFAIRTLSLKCIPDGRKQIKTFFYAIAGIGTLSKYHEHNETNKLHCKFFYLYQMLVVNTYYIYTF